MDFPSPFTSFDPEGHDHEDDPRRRRSVIPIRYLVPNIITILAICAGVTSIRLAFEGQFEKAVFMILIAAILDGLDGRVARMMGGSSPFGMQMDSLADVINFGVAPALIVYSYILADLQQIGWVAALVYCIACCLRLARFNVMAEDKKVESWKKDYFVGVPAPAGALLVLFPVYVGSIGLEKSPVWALIFSLYTFAIALLLVSRLPVWSAKSLGRKLRRDLVVPLLLVMVAYIGFLAKMTWQTLLVTTVGYLIFLPFSVYAYRKRAEFEKQKKAIKELDA